MVIRFLTTSTYLCLRKRPTLPSRDVCVPVEALLGDLKTGKRMDWSKQLAALRRVIQTCDDISTTV